jgi:membrane protein YqaA with SNARE-associated domain
MIRIRLSCHDRLVLGPVPFSILTTLMRGLFYSLLGYFLTPAGVVAMAALDSSLVFFLPLGIDFVVIILSARKPDLFWLYAVLATAGSLAGAAATFWIGRQVGEHGLSKLVNPSRLKRIQQRVSEKAAYSVAALAIIPPPFPFTAFLLTSGALDVQVWSFFVTLAGVRLLRFGIEGALAAHYGRGILTWMKSPTFEWIIGGFIVLAIGGTLLSAIAVARSTRQKGR